MAKASKARPSGYAAEPQLEAEVARLRHALADAERQKAELQTQVEDLRREVSKMSGQLASPGGEPDERFHPWSSMDFRYHTLVDLACLQTVVPRFERTFSLPGFKCMDPRRLAASACCLIAGLLVIALQGCSDEEAVEQAREDAMREGEALKGVQDAVSEYREQKKKTLEARDNVHAKKDGFSKVLADEGRKPEGDEASALDDANKVLKEEAAGEQAENVLSRACLPGSSEKRLKSSGDVSEEKPVPCPKEAGRGLPAFRRTREPPPLKFSSQNQAWHQTDARSWRRKRSTAHGRGGQPSDAPTPTISGSLLEDKQRLLGHLRSEAYVELFASPIAGVGVRAFRQIPEGVDPFPICNPHMAAKNPRFSHSLYNAMLRAYMLHASRATRFSRSLSGAEEKGRQTRQCRASLLAQLGEIERCEQVLPCLAQEPDGRSEKFVKAMKVLGELRDFQYLLKVWNLSRQKKVNLKLSAYAILIEAFGKSIGRERHEIRRLGLMAGKRAWQWMLHDGHKPDAVAVRAALHLCAKAGDAAWAAQLWESTSKSSTATWNRYLETVSRHSGPQGWETVERELSSCVNVARSSRLVPDCITLSVLVNAAAEQNDMNRADEIWERLVSAVEPTAETYAARSKSLLLGGGHERVLGLREEMEQKSISPIARNILHEVQARLLLLHQHPEDRSLYERLQETIETAQGEARAAGQEALQLRQMQTLAGSIWNGERLALDKVRVLAWRWPTEPAPSSAS
eukprot:s534_g7.t3